MFMFIFISLAFSSGIPVVYPITLLYFQITFEFERLCLVFDYGCTRVFSEELPEQAMRLIKYAVIINIVSSSYTLFMGRIYAISENSSTHFSQIVLYVDLIDRVSETHCIIFICFVLVILIGYLITMRRYIKSLFQRWNKYQTTI
jgi:hypothetical protein